MNKSIFLVFHDTLWPVKYLRLGLYVWVLLWVHGSTKQLRNSVTPILGHYANKWPTFWWLFRRTYHQEKSAPWHSIKNDIPGHSHLGLSGTRNGPADSLGLTRQSVRQLSSSTAGLMIDDLVEGSGGMVGLSKQVRTCGQSVGHSDITTEE